MIINKREREKKIEKKKYINLSPKNALKLLLDLEKLHSTQNKKCSLNFKTTYNVQLQNSLKDTNLLVLSYAFQRDCVLLPAHASCLSQHAGQLLVAVGQVVHRPEE